jgi:hypothetical protein
MNEEAHEGAGITSPEQIYDMPDEKFRASKESENSKQLAALFRQCLGLTSDHQLSVATTLYESIPSEIRTDVDAINSVIASIADLTHRPEIQASAEIARMIGEVHASLRKLRIFDATANDVAAAFAAPARRKTNRLNATKTRLTKEHGGAEKCFDSWAKNPDLYPNMAAYKRDLIAKELCDDIGTAGRWLKRFAAALPSNSPLRLKLGKK